MPLTGPPRELVRQRTTTCRSVPVAAVQGAATATVLARSRASHRIIGPLAWLTARSPEAQWFTYGVQSMDSRRPCAPCVHWQRHLWGRSSTGAGTSRARRIAAGRGWNWTRLPHDVRHPVQVPGPKCVTQRRTCPRGFVSTQSPSCVASFGGRSVLHTRPPVRTDFYFDAPSGL